MADAAQKDAAHCNVNHGFGDAETFFVIAYEPAPAHRPTESTLNHPPPWQDLEALSAVGNVGCGQFGHQQPATRIDSEMALASDNLLASSVAALSGLRGLDRLAVDDPQSGLASLPARSRSSTAPIS